MGFADEVVNGTYKKKKKSFADSVVDNTFESTLEKTQTQQVQTTKKDNKDKGFFDNWFKAGAFSDGYQFGDVTKTILGTGADLGLGVIEGIMSGGEGLGDFASYRTADVLDFFGNNAAANKLRENANINATNELMGVIKKKGKIESNSLLDKKADSIANAMGTILTMTATAGLGGAAGFGTAGQTALSMGSMGLSSAGSGESEALQSGATTDEARLYGAISGAGEVFSEMLFGGLGKGAKAIGISKGLTGADDMLAKSVSDKFKSRLAKNLSQYVIKSGAEGVEEVISGIIQAAGKKLTYMSEEDLGKLLQNEDLLDQFIIGTISSGISQSSGLVKSTSKGKDFLTGYSDNEQKIYNALLNERIEAEQSESKKPLTRKQINTIEEQLKQDFESGNVGTRKIEEVLGLGEIYGNLKNDAEMSFARELTPEELNQVGEEAKEQYADLIKDDNIIRQNYYEDSLRSQNYTADISKYDDKFKDTVQRAIDSGILNNSTKTHQFVDLLAKISADKGVTFDFTNNDKLKESSLGIDGAKVNGYVNAKGDITLNINSNKALDSVVGHELTHVLEGSELYQALSDSIKEYAESTGEYEKRLNELTELYENVEGADVQKELTADLVGDYIFTNQEFVNHLTQNRNLFQKIYDEIKYLVKQVTAGSKEARQLNKAMKMFEKAYRDNSVKLAEQENATNNKFALAYVDKARFNKEQLARLDKAIKLKENGATDEEIWKETQVIVGDKIVNSKVDIPDLKFKNREIVKKLLKMNTDVRLADVMEGDMFKNYPQFKNYEIGVYDFEKEAIKDNKSPEEVEQYKGTKGAVTTDGKIVINNTVKTLDEVEGVISHEVQHLIQEASGKEDNTADILANEGVKAYKLSPYELEAEVTRTMRELTPEQRKQINPQSVKQEIIKYYEEHNYRGLNIDTVINRLLNKHGLQFSLSINEELNNYIENNDFSLDTNGNLKVNNLTDKQIKKLTKAYNKNGYTDVNENFVRNRIEEGFKIPRAVADTFINDDLGYKPQIDTTQVFEDAEGNPLTKEQVEFYKNSDVRDIRGRLIPVYHTTDAEFTIFNPKAQTKNGKKYGKGLYFSTTPENFGNNEMKLYLNAKDGEYKFVQDKGYYIVQEPNMVKNIDNTNPTDDPDIRYSLSASGEMVDNTTGEKVELETSDTGTTGTLMAIHNLNEEKANGILDLGGFPYPSIAITKPSEFSHEGYGDISVIFNKDAINPELNSKNKVYSRDAYTPRFPKVEYKVNSNETKKIRNIIGDYDYRNVQPGDSYISDINSMIDNLEDSIDRSGLDRALENIKDSDAMKYAYLKNVNPEFQVDTKNESFSRIYNNETLQRFIDNYNGEYELNEIPSNELENYVDTMVEAYRPQVIEESNYDMDKESLDKVIEMKLNNLRKSFASQDNFRVAAYKLQKYGNEHKILDTVATKEKINNTINEVEYNKWFNNLFENIIEKKGLRNNLNYYTDRGNPRSWEQLHDEYNLNNVVKILDALDSTGTEGGMFTGVGEIAGNASIRFNNLEDIKANENLLTEIGNEEYGKMIEGFQDRISNIEDAIMDRGHENSDNYFIAKDNLSNAIADAARVYGEGKKIDSKKVKKIIDDYGFNPTLEESQTLLDMFEELRTLPTQYFEAKPKRAVGLDEAEQWVIPKDSSPEFKQRLQELNIPYTEYDSSIEGDRQRVINQFDDLKWSLSQQNEIAPVRKPGLTYGEDIALAPVQEQVSALQEDIAAIREDYRQQSEDIKKELRQLRTEREEMSRGIYENAPSINDIAPTQESSYYENTFAPELSDDLLKKYKSYFKSEFGLKGKQLNEAMEGIKELSTNPNLTARDVYNYLKENYGKEEIRNYNYDIQEVKSELRNTAIGVDEQTKKDIASMYDTYGNFRKNNLGRLKLVEYNGKNGIDRIYQNLSEQYPHIFNEDEVSNTTDQLIQLAEVSKMDNYTSMFEDLPEEIIRNDADELYSMIRDYRNETAQRLAEEKLPDSYYENMTPTEEEIPYDMQLEDNINRLQNQLDYLPRKENYDIVERQIAERINENPTINRNILDIINQENSRREGKKVELVKPVIAKDKSSIRSGIDTLKTMFINKNAEIDNLAKESGNKMIKIAGDMLNNYSAEASNDITVAQTDNYGNAIGKSVQELFESAKDSGLETAFNDYLINYSNIDRWHRGKGSQTPLDISERLVANYESKYPKFKKWAKDVWKYSENVRNNWLESGMITKNMYNLLSEAYPHYVPYISDTNNFDATMDKIRNLKARPIKKARGGATEIFPVEEALTRYTYAQKRALRQNELYKQIYNTLQTNPGQRGAEVGEGYFTGEEPNLYRDDSGNYLTAVIDGEERKVQISDDLYKSLSNDMENQIKDLEQRLSIITKPLQAVSNVRRKILTSWSPSFAIKNPVKDIQDALFNSKHTTDMVKNYIPGIRELITNSTNEVKQFKALYGEGNLMGAYANESGLYNPKNGNKNNKFLKRLSQVNEIMELAPRYAEFKASLQNGESVQEAMYNAREITTNFARGGVITKALNRNGFTFLNASVQGFDKFIRNFSGENGAKGIANSLLKAVILGVAPAVFNELAFGGGDDKDKEYEALPDYIKDNYYLFKNGDGQFIRLPKGRVLSVFGSAARRTIELAEGEQDAFEGYLNNVNNQIGINNPEENNVFAPFIQAFGSKNGTAWYGGDIVPSRLQNKPVDEQYDSSTDKMSIWLGQHLGVSPYKINYLIDQYSGGIGDIILPTITDEATSKGGLLAPVVDQFTVDSTTDNKYVSDFYSKNDELKVIANGSKATDEDILRSQYMYNISSEMAKLYAERRNIQADNSLSKAEKYEKSQAIKKSINQLAKTGLNDYNNVEITGNYANVSDLGYYKNAKGKWTPIDQKDITATESLGLNNKEMNSYYTTKNDIYNIDQKYEPKLNKANEEEKAVLNAQKKVDIINSIKKAKLPDTAKALLYDKKYASTETLDAVINCGIDFNSYLDLQAQNFTADKNIYGDTINGSKKNKVYNYINNMNLPYEKKIMLAKLEYKSDNTYNNEIISILNNDPTLDYQDVSEILKAMGFKVDDYGNITW